MEVIQQSDLMKEYDNTMPFAVFCVEKMRVMAKEKKQEIVMKNGKQFLLSVTPEKIIAAGMSLTNILPVPNQSK